MNNVKDTKNCFFISQGALSNKVQSEGKNIAVYISVSLVALIAILIGIVVAYFRYV